MSANGKPKRLIGNGDQGRLRPREIAFVHALIDNNFQHAVAAEKVGHKKGSAAAVAASTYLKRPLVRAYLQQKLDALCPSDEQIKARYGEVAFANIADFVSLESGTINKRHFKRRGYLVRRFKRTRNGDEIEMVDPLNALEKLARMKGLLSDDAAQRPVQVNLQVNVTKEQLPQ